MAWYEKYRRIVRLGWMEKGKVIGCKQLKNLELKLRGLTLYHYHLSYNEYVLFAIFFWKKSIFEICLTSQYSYLHSVMEEKKFGVRWWKNKKNLPPNYPAILVSIKLNRNK